MDPVNLQPNRVCHVVAIPYPGRGHINPMMHLCKLLSSKKPDILITFVVTEEWLGFIGSEPVPSNIRFASLPNVIPSELVRANDFPAFLEAVGTKMQAPFEQLLRRLNTPVTITITDGYLEWAIDVANQRNIPVAALWTISATVFSLFFHFDLLVQHGHFPAELSERGEEIVDYIPGVSKTRLVDLPTFFSGNGLKVYKGALQSVRAVYKAQYLLFTSFYELESQAIDSLKPIFPFPVYTLGPSIPFPELDKKNPLTTPHYLQWLDSQPKGSVLYISLGSFLSVSSSQMDEIVNGVRISDVRYLFVSQGESSKHVLCGGIGLVVPWCDQLRVLCHDSIGGFWTHCGWNSTLEAVFSGVPVLTFPIFWDQVPNGKNIVDDWGMGLRVKEVFGDGNLVSREEIAETVRKFMDLESEEGKQIRERAKRLKDICRGAAAKGGSSDTNLDCFLRDILEVHGR